MAIETVANAAKYFGESNVDRIHCRAVVKSFYPRVLGEALCSFASIHRVHQKRV